MPARRIGIEIAADEPQLVDAAFKLRDASLNRNTRALRQLTDADEIVRKQIADAMDAVIGKLRPLLTDLEVADMVSHARSARREQRQRSAPLSLDAELIALDAGAEFLVTDLDRRRRGQRRAVFGGCSLLLAEIHQRLGFGRVVA